MRQLWTKRWFRALAGVLAISCVAVVFACWRFRIWTYADYQAYQEVRRYSIGEDLWFGRIKAGQDLETFTTEYPPHRSRRFGRFTLLNYYTGGPPRSNSIPMESMSVVAKDGRLVNAIAAGCTWHRVFFEMGTEDQSEYEAAWEAYIRPL